MPEIGAMLREARMRERIDISEIEAQTKIRAKYLRALENEEWDLLPGSTYVKTFLRTYAEALGIDGRLLVEEYKLNHERPSELELQPIMPSASRERDRRRRAGPRRPCRPRSCRRRSRCSWSPPASSTFAWSGRTATRSSTA
jgi:cytoskeletal protein RodZ